MWRRCDEAMDETRTNEEPRTITVQRRWAFAGAGATVAVILAMGAALVFGSGDDRDGDFDRLGGPPAAHGAPFGGGPGGLPPGAPAPDGDVPQGVPLPEGGVPDGLPPQAPTDPQGGGSAGGDANGSGSGN